MSDTISARLRHQAGHDILYDIGTEMYVATLATIEPEYARAAADDVRAMRDRLVKLAAEHPLERGTISDSI